MLNRDVADIGFVGSDKLEELQLSGRYQNLSREPIASANCSLVAAGRFDSRVLQQRDRIATSYPNMTNRWLAEYFFAVPNSVSITFCPSGSVEAYVDLGVADVVVDIREKGETLRANNLPFYVEIEPITTDVVYRDSTKPKEAELDLSGLYAALKRIDKRKIPVGTFTEERWKSNKSLTELMFDDPNVLVKKIGSESAEFIQDLVKRDGRALVYEAQDVIYALAVALSSLDRSLIEALNKL